MRIARQTGKSVRGKDVKTVDGRVVNSYSEEWRCHCEANMVFKKYRTKNTRQKYLAEVFRLRGQAGYQQLYDEMLRIHKFQRGDKNES